jgi:hypothetical protein
VTLSQIAAGMLVSNGLFGIEGGVTVRFMGLGKLPSSEIGMLSSVFVFLDQRRTKWSKLISFEEIRMYFFCKKTFDKNR